MNKTCKSQTFFWFYLKNRFTKVNLTNNGYNITNKITNVMRCAILCHLHNLKNVKNTHEEVLLLVKLQDFFKFYEWYQIPQRITNKFKLCYVCRFY